MNEWIDKNGFIKPQLAWKDSGNGLFYSAFLNRLKARCSDLTLDEAFELEGKAIGLMLKPGVLYRTPDNQFGQEQFDNYLGLCGAFTLNRTPFREIIEYGVDNHFIFDTDGKFESKDFLGRFPHIFLLIHEIGYPTASPLIASMIEMFGKNLPADKGNASGVHLTWMYLETALRLGVDVYDRFTEVSEMLPDSTRAYFGAGHTIIKQADKLQGIL